MKTVKLIVREDREIGELGLMVEGTPIIHYPMVAREGTLVAHDLLEHVNGVESIGSIGDELEALGGVWFVRGQYCDIRRPMGMYSPEENLAYDVSNMGRMYIESDVPLRVPVPNNKAGDHEDELQEIIRYAKKPLKAECEYFIEYHGMSNYLDKRDEYLDASLKLMRQGFRKARKKYGTGYRVNSLFWTIAEEVDKVVKHIEYEGQEFMLQYDMTNCIARCWEHYEYEEEYSYAY